MYRITIIHFLWKCDSRNLLVEGRVPYILLAVFVASFTSNIEKHVSTVFQYTFVQLLLSSTLVIVTSLRVLSGKQS
jgi:hypothetical protein